MAGGAAHGGGVAGHRERAAGGAGGGSAAGVHQARAAVRAYGQPAWVERIAKRLVLESSMRDPWRPRKHQATSPSNG